VNFPWQLALQRKNLEDSLRFNVVEIARITSHASFQPLYQEKTCSLAHEQTPLSDTIDSALRHWEECQAKELPALPRRYEADQSPPPSAMVKNSYSYIKKAQGQSYLHGFPSTNINVNFQTLMQKYNIRHKTTHVPPCSFLVLLIYPVLDSLSQGIFSSLWPQIFEMHAKGFGRVSMINTCITLLPKYITNHK
jgi:hypothetical protein